MTPELLRDVEALCDSTEEYAMIYDSYGHKACPFRMCAAQGRDGYALNHKADCPVLLAKRIRERMKTDD